MNPKRASCGTPSVTRPRRGVDPLQVRGRRAAGTTPARAMFRIVRLFASRSRGTRYRRTSLSPLAPPRRALPAAAHGSRACGGRRLLRGEHGARARGSTARPRSLVTRRSGVRASARSVHRLCRMAEPHAAAEGAVPLGVGRASARSDVVRRTGSSRARRFLVLAAADGLCASLMRQASATRRRCGADDRDRRRRLQGRVASASRCRDRPVSSARRRRWRRHLPLYLLKRAWKRCDPKGASRAR